MWGRGEREGGGVREREGGGLISELLVNEEEEFLCPWYPSVQLQEMK